MCSYLPRAIDAELDVLGAELPAIALEGPKAVGKTATATRRARTVLAMDRPAERALLEADFDLLRSLARPVLIDEWQRYPATWDMVRRAVDDGADGGSFLLTGSAAPLDAPVHSGAGRIATLRMRPLSLAERGLATPTVSLSQLVADPHQALSGSTSLGLQDYVTEILASGFPGIRPLPGRARRVQLDGYLDRIVHRDFAEQGQPIRRPAALRAWLTSYAAAVSTTASYTAILDAATPGDTDKPAKTTTSAYRSVLQSLWLLDPVPGWLPTHSALGRLGSAPKHQLADPALAARLLGIDASTLLSGRAPATVDPRAGGSMLGRLFESLVTLSMQTYARTADCRISHLRTRNGDHEIDLIVEAPEGRVVAVEVKLAELVTDADVRHLRWLSDRLQDRLIDSVVVTTGRRAYRRADGIAVVPAALLGP